jgi:hypothetical protein
MGNETGELEGISTELSCGTYADPATTEKL